MAIRSPNNHLRSGNGWNGSIFKLDNEKESVFTKKQLSGWIVIHDKEDGSTEVIEPTFATKEKLAKDNLCRYAEWMKWGKNNWNYWESQKYHVVKATLTIEEIS